MIQEQCYLCPYCKQEVPLKWEIYHIEPCFDKYEIYQKIKKIFPGN